MRLPVILVQNPPAAGAALAEALVGNLIGRAGLDLTLVDRFDSLSPESTDRMTLDAITVPSAILDWKSPPEMLATLEAIEFHGVRCPHRLDPAESTERGNSSRRLFLFDLTKHTDALKIVAELDRLKESLAVKTFTLGSNGTTPRPSGPPTPRDGESDSKTVSGDSPVDSPVGKPEPVAATPGIARSDQNLDALIDQLDDLDV